MENLVKIKLVFENCDSITIDRKHIYNFFISNITESIIMVANALIVDKCASQSSLTIKWDEVKELNTIMEEDRTFADRILGRDITTYYLYLTDGTELKIRLPWGEQEYTNTKEIHKINNNLFSITHNL